MTESPPSPTPAAGLNGTLFLVSVLGLFLEVMLIRLIGTSIPLFSYLGNALLVVCFLGLGMGCLTSRRPFAVRDVLWPLGILLFVLAVPQTRDMLQSTGKLLEPFTTPSELSSHWQTMSATTLIGCALVGFTLLGLTLLLVWDVFVPLGRLLARTMDDHPHIITAYSVNIAGSLVGTWLFVLLSAFFQPPVVWVAVAAGLLLLLVVRQRRATGLELGSLVGLVVLAWAGGLRPGALAVEWSPYQSLLLYPVPKSEPESAPVDEYYAIGEYTIWIASPYQAMLNLDPDFVAQDPKRFPPSLRGLSQYDLPYLLQPKHDKVLIVGAGSGNDVAAALRHGAKEIVAVDIDPAIVDLGRRYHPEKPYDSPKVRVVLDDARSYFATTTEKFDLIVFGLLDSPQASTAMTNARLDHYVYTRESLSHARSLLVDRTAEQPDGGVIVLTFEMMRPFMPSRMFETITDAFGAPPIYFRIPKSQYGWGGVMFAVAKDQTDQPETQLARTIAANPRLTAQIAEWRAKQSPNLVTPGWVPMATDNWPYIYLERPQVPLLFFCFMVLLLLLFLRGLWQLQDFGLFRTWGLSHWHFFFLGAAFMLLEVQNVSKAAVVLGNTWVVNAVVISGVLCLVLLANLIAAKFPTLPLGPVYALLIGSCVALYFVDLSSFAFLPYLGKALVVGLLMSLPMLFSGIVFIRSFAAVEHKDTALGANLFGALVGALLQIVTFLTGIKALLLIVAVLYLAALALRPTRPVAVQTPVPTPSPA